MHFGAWQSSCRYAPEKRAESALPSPNVFGEVRGDAGSCRGRDPSVLDVLVEVGGLSGREATSVLGEIILVEGRRGSCFVDVLDGLPSIGFITPDSNGAIAARNLDKVVAMMRHCHEQGPVRDTPV